MVEAYGVVVSIAKKKSDARLNWGGDQCRTIARMSSVKEPIINSGSCLRICGAIRIYTAYGAQQIMCIHAFVNGLGLMG